MNQLKIKKYRYWLTYLRDDLSVGAEFQPGILHITFLTWFVSELGEEEIIETFYKKFSKVKTFDVKVGKQIMLGPKKDVAVNLLELNPEVLNLHQAGLAWFKQIHARWAVKQPHVDNDYVPHIRRRGGSSFNEGDIWSLSSLSLVKALRHEDGSRLVAARAIFNEED